MRTIGELHAQTAAALRRVPALAIDQNLGVSGLHANHERSEVVPLVARAGRCSVCGATAVSGGRRRIWGLRGLRRLDRSGALARLPCRNRLHHVLDRDRAFAPEEHGLLGRSITVKIELELVLACLDPEPLEGAIELVGRADEVAVDEDLGLFGCDLQAGGARQIVSSVPVYGGYCQYPYGLPQKNGS